MKQKIRETKNNEYNLNTAKHFSERETLEKKLR